MTNQEAIERIKDHIDIHKINEKSAVYIYEALDMAISALQEQDTKTRKICDTCKHYPPSKKWPCMDCDMREPADRWESQECQTSMIAIDTNGLDEEIRCEICRNPMHTNRGCDGNCTYDEKLYEKIMQILERRIKHVSSVTPKQRWIPCSERLPEKPNMYTVTDSKGDVVRFVFCDTESSREYWLRCAKAWMPLPKPYRAEGITDD